MHDCELCWLVEKIKWNKTSVVRCIHSPIENYWAEVKFHWIGSELKNKVSLIPMRKRCANMISWWNWNHHLFNTSPRNHHIHFRQCFWRLRHPHERNSTQNRSSCELMRSLTHTHTKEVSKNCYKIIQIFILCAVSFSMCCSWWFCPWRWANVRFERRSDVARFDIDLGL